MRALNPEPSHSEKSAVKANLGPIMSINVCRQTRLPAGLKKKNVFTLMLEQRHLVGSHGNRQHRGDG